jgi:HlyD family secretion protein
VLATIQPQPSSFLDPRSQAEAEARLKAAEAVAHATGTQVERAKASLMLAEKEMARAKELKQSGAIATKEWDSAESQVNVLTRELNASEFALQVAEFEYAQAQATLQMQAKSPTTDSGRALQDHLARKRFCSQCIRRELARCRTRNADHGGRRPE